MIRNEWAFEMDSDVFIHIDDAIKSTPYRCTNPNCKLEVRRRAGTREPHFYHLNPNKENPCGGGEGPRHKKTKEMLAKSFAKYGDYYNVKIEERIGNYVVDIFLQTKYGPFYFEVIDSHEPEEEKWNNLEGRIIPFWIAPYWKIVEDGHYDEELVLQHIEEKALETLRYHFALIEMRVEELSNRKSSSLEEIWFDQGIHGIFRYVQNIHRKLEGDIISLWGRTNPKKKPIHSKEALLESFQEARRKLRKKPNRDMLNYRGWD